LSDLKRTETESRKLSFLLIFRLTKNFGEYRQSGPVMKMIMH